MDDCQEENPGVLPRSTVEVRMPPGAGVPRGTEGEAPPPQVPARTALNLISLRLAQQAAALMNDGVDPEWIIAMHLEHLAGVLALYEPAERRKRETDTAIRRLRDLIPQKVAKRRGADRRNGFAPQISGYRPQ